jgi:predicted transcriptional regulator
MHVAKENKSITISMRMTAAQAARLHQLAEADDRPPSTLARKLIAAALDRADEKNAALTAAQ